jgi:hypothetical protein
MLQCEMEFSRRVAEPTDLLERKMEMARGVAELMKAVGSIKEDLTNHPQFLHLPELRRLSQSGVPDTELAPLREYMAGVTTAEVLEFMELALVSGCAVLREKAGLIAAFHRRWKEDSETRAFGPNYDFDKKIEPWTAAEGFALVAIATPPSEENNYYSQMLNSILKPAPPRQLKAGALLPSDACSDDEVLLAQVE